MLTAIRDWLDLRRRRRARIEAVRAAAVVFSNRPNDPTTFALLLAVLIEGYLMNGGDAVGKNLGMIPSEPDPDNPPTGDGKPTNVESLALHRMMGK